jgi:hypothetical protein
MNNHNNSNYIDQNYAALHSQIETVSTYNRLIFNRLQGLDLREKIGRSLVTSDLTSVTSADEPRVLMIY